MQISFHICELEIELRKNNKTPCSNVWPTTILRINLVTNIKILMQRFLPLHASVRANNEENEADNKSTVHCLDRDEGC